MNPRIKQLWLDALRSGDYEQGTGRLRTGNRFCCLGVLCDLHSKETGAGRWEGAGEGGERWYELPGNSLIFPKTAEFYLPTEVAIWAGIADAESNLDDCACPDSIETGSVHVLVTANDFSGISEFETHTGNERIHLSEVNDQGHPFSVIADLIEASMPARSAAEAV